MCEIACAQIARKRVRSKQHGGSMGVGLAYLMSFQNSDEAGNCCSRGALTRMHQKGRM